MVCVLMLNASAVWAESVALDVVESWVRAPIPGRSMSAAFLTIKNTGEQDQVLLAVKSDLAKAIEIHGHEHDGGVMRMRQVESLVLPAGETLRLEPGGLHLMLFGLDKKVKTGGSMPLTLVFKSGDTLLTHVSVISILDE